MIWRGSANPQPWCGPRRMIAAWELRARRVAIEPPRLRTHRGSEVLPPAEGEPAGSYGFLVFRTRIASRTGRLQVASTVHAGIGHNSTDRRRSCLRGK